MTAATKKNIDLRLSELVGVTTHAIEKLRERQPAGSQYSSMSDKELRTLLERAWKQGRSTEAVELWWEKIEDTDVLNYVVDLGPALGDLLGLVREDDRTPGRPCFITIVTKQMAERSRTMNRWARTPDKLGGTLSHTMAPQLEGARAPARIEKIVVTWVSEGKLRFQAIPKDTAGAFIETLLQNGVDEKSIEFWVQSSAKIRRHVVVDFE